MRHSSIVTLECDDALPNLCTITHKSCICVLRPTFLRSALRKASRKIVPACTSCRTGQGFANGAHTCNEHRHTNHLHQKGPGPICKMFFTKHPAQSAAPSATLVRSATAAPVSSGTVLRKTVHRITRVFVAPSICDQLLKEKERSHDHLRPSHCGSSTACPSWDPPCNPPAACRTRSARKPLAGPLRTRPAVLV